MKIGDEVLTPKGRGVIVRGSNYGKRPARGQHWVFLFYPANLTNRVILFHPSELKFVKGQ